MLGGFGTTPIIVNFNKAIIKILPNLKVRMNFERFPIVLELTKIYVLGETNFDCRP